MTPHSTRYQLDRLRYALGRRRKKQAIESLYADLLSSLDKKAFIERFKDYWDPFETADAKKFLKIDHYLREAIFRALFLELDKGPRPRRILDLGSGAGYFLKVCQHLGHQVCGLEIPGESLYEQCFDFFQLPRQIHRIEPQQPLPPFDHKWDLITAFMTTFNEYDNRHHWSVDTWSYFLADVRRHLTDSGRFVILFNLNSQTHDFYTGELRSFFLKCPGFNVRFFFEYGFFESC